MCIHTCIGMSVLIMCASRRIRCRGCRDQKSYAAKSLRMYMWSQHMYMECSTKTYRYLANRFAKESIFENITQLFYRMPNFLYYAKLYLRIYSPTDNHWGQYLFTIQVLAVLDRFYGSHDACWILQNHIRCSSHIIIKNFSVYKHFLYQISTNMKFGTRSQNLQKSWRGWTLPVTLACAD